MKLNSQSHVVFYTNERDSDQMLLRLLAQSGARISLIESATQLQMFLVERSTKVLFLATENLQASLDLYYRAFNEVQNQPICQHAVVALVCRHEEQDAYEAYCGGLLDDYLVARPLYELHRPVVICSHLFRKLGLVLNPHGQQQNDELSFAKTNRQISKGLKIKAQIKSDIEHTISFIETSLDEALKKIQLQQDISLNFSLLRQTLAQIKSDDIRPELLRLQQKVIDILSVMIAEDQQTAKASVDTDDDQLPELPDPVPAASQYNRLYQTVNTEHIVNVELNKIRRILLVEDDQISLNLTLMMLKQCGAEVDTATCGRIAFSYMKNKKYDFVFMDINLPDTNGLYVLDQIQRNVGTNQQTPFIMLTGNKNKDVVKQAIERGAKGYLLKPLYKDAVEKIFEKFSQPGH